jgi:hypothetical protein
MGTMSVEESEKRIAKILGVKKDEELPDVSKKTLKIYCSYLDKNLSFPFDAEYSVETGPLENRYYDIKVTDLLELGEFPSPEFYGVICKGSQGRHKIEIPLADLTVKQKGKNRQLIEDYCRWFWNYS